MSLRLRASFVLLVLAALALVGIVYVDTNRRFEAARADFIAHARDETRLNIRGIDTALTISMKT